MICEVIDCDRDASNGSLCKIHCMESFVVKAMYCIEHARDRYSSLPDDMLEDCTKSECIESLEADLYTPPQTALKTEFKCYVVKEYETGSKKPVHVLTTHSLEEVNEWMDNIDNDSAFYIKNELTSTLHKR